MADNGLRYWLALGALRGLERFDLKSLLERFGGPEEIFKETSSALSAFSTELAANVKGFNSWKRVDDELKEIERLGIKVVAFDSPEYPKLLKGIHDAPAALYVKGNTYDHKKPTVAIVGTRRPTHYGLRMAETLARDLASFGVTIISGMARGCDAAAHKGALSSGGFTVAVLGTGIDIAYPKDNGKLYGEIAEKGLLVSEYPIGTPPVPQNFPRRNRIISGLSEAVLVIEAPLRSGSLMTARLTLEYGREVLAVPGQATSNKSTGTNRLIKDGAALIENAEDVMNALQWKFVAPEEEDDAGPPLFPEEKMLLKSLAGGPLHIDGIVDITGLSVSKASSLLLEMEFKGYVEQLPGKCFLRKF